MSYKLGMAKPRTNLDVGGKPRGKRRPERRSILKTALIKKFCTYVETGLPPDAVCDLLCISNTTYYEWLRKGEQYLEDTESYSEFHLYGSFVLEFRMAFARYRVKLQQCAHNPGIDWRRAVAILERRDRHTWAKQEPIGGTDEEYDPDEHFL